MESLKTYVNLSANIKSDILEIFKLSSAKLLENHLHLVQMEAVLILLLSSTLTTYL